MNPSILYPYCFININQYRNEPYKLKEGEEALPTTAEVIVAASQTYAIPLGGQETISAGSRQYHLRATQHRGTHETISAGMLGQPLSGTAIQVIL